MHHTHRGEGIGSKGGVPGNSALPAIGIYIMSIWVPSAPHAPVDSPLQPITPQQPFPPPPQPQPFARAQAATPGANVLVVGVQAGLAERIQALRTHHARHGRVHAIHAAQLRQEERGAQEAHRLHGLRTQPHTPFRLVAWNR